VEKQARLTPVSKDLHIGADVLYDSNKRLKQAYESNG